VTVQPEEVLKLIRSAPQRYHTVRAALRYRGDGPTIKALRDRYHASEAGRLETGGSPGPSEKIRRPEPDGPFGWRCRVWYASVSPERGERYRLEVELPREVYPGGGVDISAWDGRIVGSSGTDTVVNSRIGGGPREDDPLWLVLAQDSFWTTYLFDPDNIAGLPLSVQDLSVEGKTRKAGREAIRLVGVPLEEWDHFPEPLWWGADEYEFLVDAERGVLLRCASRRGRGLRRPGGRGDPLRRALPRGRVRLSRAATVALAGRIPR
jgi:hypothetical protein